MMPLIRGFSFDTRIIGRIFLGGRGKENHFDQRQGKLVHDLG